MDVAFTQQGAFYVAELMEAEQKAAAGKVEMPGVGRALPFAVGLADRAIQVEDEFSHWLVFPELINPHP
jgi:hypothetical protein